MGVNYYHQRRTSRGRCASGWSGAGLAAFAILLCLATIASGHGPHSISFFGIKNQGIFPVEKTVSTVDPASRGVHSTLIAYPEIIERNEDVIVKWEPFEGWQPFDFIAVYCPTAASDENYLDIRYIVDGLVAVPFNTSETVNSVIFPSLLNMRCDYQFRYFSNPPQAKMATCDTSVVDCMDSLTQFLPRSRAHSYSSMKALLTKACSRFACPTSCFSHQNDEGRRSESNSDDGTSFDWAFPICSAASKSFPRHHYGDVFENDDSGDTYVVVNVEHLIPDIPKRMSLDSILESRSTISKFSLWNSKVFPARRISTSNTVTFRETVDFPMHSRLALTGDPTEMLVQFTSNQFIPLGIVNLWTVNAATNIHDGSLRVPERQFIASDFAHTYHADDLCSSPANATTQRTYRDPGYFHEVLLTGLVPGQTYAYEYGQFPLMGTELSSDGTGFQPANAVLKSKVTTFRMPPAVGPQNTVSMIAFGDMGTDIHTSFTQGRSTISHLNEYLDEFDLVLHFGDLAYAMGAGYIWERWMNTIESVSSRRAYMVSIGNHEYDHLTGGEKDPSSGGVPGGGFHPAWGNYGCDSYGECGVPTANRFRMPGTRTRRSPSSARSLLASHRTRDGASIDSDSVGQSSPRPPRVPLSTVASPASSERDPRIGSVRDVKFWYSFDVGNVHITMMSTEHDYTPGSEQYSWIRGDLETVNRSVTPFVIFTGHRSMFNSVNMSDQVNVSLGMQRSFQSLLVENHVDLALWGHIHQYERSCPIKYGVCTSEGPEQGVIHLTVGTAGAPLHYGYDCSSPFGCFLPMHWARFASIDWGFLKIQTTVDELHALFYRNSDDSIGDSVIIKKKY